MLAQISRTERVLDWPTGGPQIHGLTPLCRLLIIKIGDFLARPSSGRPRRRVVAEPASGPAYRLCEVDPDLFPDDEGEHVAAGLRLEIVPSRAPATVQPEYE
jgi:hypothetical protein